WGCRPELVTSGRGRRRDRLLGRLPVAEEDGEVGLLAAATGRLGAPAHRALALEHGALVDDEAAAVDVPDHLARRAQLEPRAGLDVAGHLTVHDDGRARDLRLHDRALADRERVLGRDLALDLALDADAPLEVELADDLRALAEERARRAQLLRSRRLLILIPLEHLHLPGRRLGCGDRRCGGTCRRRGGTRPRPVVPFTVFPEQRHGLVTGLSAVRPDSMSRDMAASAAGAEGAFFLDPAGPALRLAARQ